MKGTTHKLKPSPASGPSLWHFHGPENPSNVPQCGSAPLPEFPTLWISTALTFLEGNKVHFSPKICDLDDGAYYLMFVTCKVVSFWTLSLFSLFVMLSRSSGGEMIHILGDSSGKSNIDLNLLKVP